MAGTSPVPISELRQPAVPDAAAGTSLMFQTGYPGIKSADSTFVKVAPPNFELKFFLASWYLQDILHHRLCDCLPDGLRDLLAKAFEQADFAAARTGFNLILKSFAPPGPNF